MNRVYDLIIKRKQNGVKSLAILIDPDKPDFIKQTDLRNLKGVDYFFVGGSLISQGSINDCIKLIKDSCDIPVVLFPGNEMQINKLADAILFLSLISGRNPEMLIGKHVTAAPIIKKAGLEPIATGYILVDGGKPTAVQYISHTMPIPADKPEIAVSTALAGEMLGLKVIYLEAGSGAIQPVPMEMIKQINEKIKLPLIVGGGIRSKQEAIHAFEAGADIIVVGSAIERSHKLITELTSAAQEYTAKTNMP